MRARGVTRLGLAVLVIGLVITAVLSWLAYTINSRNESRLLALQTKETGAVLQVILPTIQTPLASAAELAASDGGNPASFTSYMANYVGAHGTFVSVGLWQVTGTTAVRIAHLGVDSDLAATPAQANSVIIPAAGTRALTVIGPVGANQNQLRLGYAFASAGATPAYVVYAESPLPAGRRANVQAGSPFSDLRFALYLGKSPSAAALLETNSASLPVTGRTATVTVAFGANNLTLVAAPVGQLGGALPGILWWLVAIVGVILALGSALLTERLVRRRRSAEALMLEVEKLLGEQRSIAVSLQHALLPQRIPSLPGVEIGARYIAGVSGVEIGGDWYDLVPLDGQRFFFVVGDVSGRGVNAGTVMASLLFAIRGFVSEGHSPERILDTLAGLLDVSRDGHFATVLCGIADIGRHEVTFANAGHLPPLVISDGSGSFIELPIGPPIGVRRTSPGYRALTVPVAAGATLVAYTDGLVERPGERLDVGLGRLRDLVSTPPGPAGPGSLEELLDTMVTELTHDAYHDDTAILGIRWLK